jgi:hypothetical protein
VLRATGTFVLTTSQQLIATALAAGAIIALSKTEREDEKKAQRYHEYKQQERDLVRSHSETSECMAALQVFKLKHGESYGDAYLKGMKNSTRDAEISKVNSCRSLTKDHWELVIAWAEEYRDLLAEDPQKREKYRSRYNRFVRLVQPLDRLDGYSQAEFMDIYQKEVVFSNHQ